MALSLSSCSTGLENLTSFVDFDFLARFSLSLAFSPMLLTLVCDCLIKDCFLCLNASWREREEGRDGEGGECKRTLVCTGWAREGSDSLGVIEELVDKTSFVEVEPALAPVSSMLSSFDSCRLTSND